MGLTISGGSGGSPATPTNIGPQGPPASATGQQIASPPWRPGSNPPLREADTLLLLQPTDENQVLAQGGRLHTNTQAYFSQTRAVLGTGPFVAKSFPQDSDGNTHAVYAVDGAFPSDEWTIEFWAKSKAVDFRSQSGTGRLLTLVDDNSAVLKFECTASNGQVSVRYVDKGGTPGAQAVATLQVADWPADTWKCFAATLKAGTLTMMFGDNVRSGTASATSPQTIWGTSGGVMPSGGPSAATGAYETAEVHVRRFARTYNTEISVKGPTVTVDATTSQGAFPTDLFGVFAQYPGWRNLLIDGSTGGGGPGLTGNAIRNALITAQCAAGMRFARIDHVFDKVTTTGSGATPSVSSWANLDDQMDALYNGGVTKFHVTLGYCPSALGGSGAFNQVPNDNTGFAKLCSDAVAHMTARYPSATFQWTLWNEPEGSSFWQGTTTQYTTMWAAVQSRLSTDYGILLGGPDTSSAVATSGASGYQKALIDYCATNSLPIGRLQYHGYSSTPSKFYTEIAAIRAYLIAQGIANASTVPIGITEWNLDLSIGNQRHDNSGASAASLNKLRNPYRDEFQPAFVHATLCAAQTAGASFALYTRMGILDASYTSTERELGLFTNDNPPRPLPVYGAFQGMWKHSGNRVSATSNYPHLTCLASKAASGKIVATFANFRPAEGALSAPVGFEWTGLPGSYTWKLYRMDGRDAHDGRLNLIQSGTQANPPSGVDLRAVGFGCIEITPA